MSKIVRPRVEFKNIKLTKELVKHPQSTDFNDCLSFLINDYKRLCTRFENSFGDVNADSKSS